MIAAPSRTAHAASLGWLRSLLLLARAEASGTLALSAHGRHASIRLARGKVIGFEGELGPRLGEIVGLSRSEGFVAPAGASWGACAVAAGRVSRNDLAWALRRQLRLRAREIALWGGLETRWHARSSAARPFTDPMNVVDLVAEILRAYVETNLGATEARAAPIASPLGHYFVENAALHPQEIAASRGVIRSAAGARFASALLAAGLTEAPVEPEVRALTRLHARVRHEGPRAVLGDARDAVTRRRALRRVAGGIHPDRFADDPRLGSISHELVSRLVGS
jgi:hypothetical protein